jgi:hypothetical protein
VQAGNQGSKVPKLDVDIADGVTASRFRAGLQVTYRMLSAGVIGLVSTLHDGANKSYV